MIPIAEMLPWEETPLWKLAVQAGATHAVGYFRSAVGAPPVPERPCDGGQALVHPPRATGRGRGEFAQAFTEELDPTSGRCAAETADPHVRDDGPPNAGQIAQGALVPTMHSVGVAATVGTSGSGSCGGDEHMDGDCEIKGINVDTQYT